MIIYSVTTIIEASVESKWVDWMTRIHVPDVLRTGCFSECRMSKVLGSEFYQERDLTRVIQRVSR